jgi:hypothetical protein
VIGAAWAGAINRQAEAASQKEKVFTNDRFMSELLAKGMWVL